MQNETRRPILLLHSALILLPFLLLGCSSTALVKVQPVHSKDVLSIGFPRTCYVRDQSGQDQILLESSPIDEPPSASPGSALPPVTAPPLWQVLVINLHWRTPSAGHRDFPVADNAVLHWYVYGKPDENGTAVLHYVGTGAVSVSADINSATVSIHNAELRLIERHGNLHDPLADFYVNTSFHTLADPEHAQQILDDLNKALAEAKQPAAVRVQ